MIILVLSSQSFPFPKKISPNKQCIVCHIYCYVVPPSNPNNLHVESTGEGHISLAWQPVEETAKAPVDGYFIEMATGDSKNFKQVGKIEGRNMCKFYMTDLKDGEKYVFSD